MNDKLVEIYEKALEPMESLRLAYLAGKNEEPDFVGITDRMCDEAKVAPHSDSAGHAQRLAFYHRLKRAWHGEQI